MTKNEKERLIILDSCILMLPLEKKINLSSLNSLAFSHKIVVPEIVIKELTKLTNSKKESIRRKAKLALSLAKKYEIIHSSGVTYADDEILKIAKKYNAIVATTDKELRKKLREEGLAIITLVGKTELKIIGQVDK